MFITPNVPTEHTHTARLSLITNKEARKFQELLLRAERTTTVRRAVAPSESHHFNSAHSHLCVIGTLGLPRLEMTINKTEVSVCSAADSSGDSGGPGGAVVSTQ